MVKVTQISEEFLGKQTQWSPVLVKLHAFIPQFYENKTPPGVLS